jgi:hypothetical protein
VTAGAVIAATMQAGTREVKPEASNALVTLRREAAAEARAYTETCATAA